MKFDVVNGFCFAFSIFLEDINNIWLSASSWKPKIIEFQHIPGGQKAIFDLRHFPGWKKIFDFHHFPGGPKIFDFQQFPGGQKNNIWLSAFSLWSEFAETLPPAWSSSATSTSGPNHHKGSIFHWTRFPKKYSYWRGVDIIYPSHYDIKVKDVEKEKWKLS